VLLFSTVLPKTARGQLDARLLQLCGTLLFARFAFLMNALVGFLCSPADRLDLFDALRARRSLFGGRGAPANSAGAATNGG
jgi:hypothetical protein